MRQSILCLVLVFFCFISLAQKKPLDLKDYPHWPLVEHAVQSANGNYEAFIATDSQLVIKSSNRTDTLSLPGNAYMLPFYFNESSTQLIYQQLVLRAKPPIKVPPGKPTVDLWWSKDSVLMSEQLYRLSAPDSFLLKTVVDLSDKKIISSDSLKWDGSVQLKVPSIADLLPRPGFIWYKKQPVQILSNKTRLIDAKNWFYLTPSVGYNTAVAYAKKNKLPPPTGIVPGLPDTLNVVLYTPDNFDTLKRYPVIINLTTGDDSTGLSNPVLSNGRLNIPFFVSNGFIVLSMQTTIYTGRPGPAMLDRVRLTVSWLKKQRWANFNRLGLYGDGLSAYMVTYIVCKTKVFKAAVESGGVNDLISHYGSIDSKGRSLQPFYDLPGTFFAKTLWEDTAAYIWQSPVMLADRIETPLLMLHSKEDMRTAFAQGIELFTGMRRLGNRCWMLQYDDQDYFLTGAKVQYDYSLRLLQFYNHYLKGAFAPIWMLDGVPAKYKGIKTGLELDNTGRVPKPIFYKNASPLITKKGRVIE